MWSKYGQQIQWCGRESPAKMWREPSNNGVDSSQEDPNTWDPTTTSWLGFDSVVQAQLGFSKVLINYLSHPKSLQ